MNKTTVAILLHDALKAVGLKHLLESLYSVTVKTIERFEGGELMSENVDYIFTDPLHFAAHIKFFIPRQAKTIVVCDNVASGIDRTTHLLCCNQSYEAITSQLDSIFDKNGNEPTDADGMLSKRETEVLRLVASGLINKEIAEQLNISINTVLTHRKNITAKLGIKSASGLSFYALMNGIIDPK